MKIILFLLFFFYFVIPTHASEQIVEIRTIGFPPLGINDQGELSGIYYELANLTAERAGYSINNQITPYARIIKEIKAGKIDLTIMFRNRDLDPYVQYIAALPSKNTVAIGLPSHTFSTLSDLSGKKIAYLRGSSISHKIDNDKSIIKYPVNSYMQAIKMLLAGRVDAVFGAPSTIKNSALGLEKITNIAIEFNEPLVVDKKTPWIQVSNKSLTHIDIEKLKESYAQLEEEDTLNTLLQKYSSYN